MTIEEINNRIVLATAAYDANHTLENLNVLTFWYQQYAAAVSAAARSR